MTDIAQEFAGTIHIQGYARNHETWLNWLQELADTIAAVCPGVNSVFVDPLEVPVASRRVDLEQEIARDIQALADLFPDTAA